MIRTNRDIVAELYLAVAQGNIQPVQDFTAPQFAVCQTTELPWGGKYEGIVGFQTFIGKLIGIIESHLTIEEYIEAGNQVVALGRTVGQVKDTGIQFNVRVVDVWTFDKGRVTCFEAYIDTPAMLRALGKL